MTDGWVGRYSARIAVAAVLLGLVWFAREQLLQEDPRDRRIGQRVRLLDAPKPPPPKIEEKPIEVPRAKEIEVQTELAKQAPGPKEAGDRLGLDAEGSGGSDAFGLEARQGGRDITTIGGDKSGGGGVTAANWGWYGGVIRRHLEQITRTDKRLQGHTFQVVIRIWVAPSGRLTDFDLVGSSGSEDVDRGLRELLAGAPPMPEPPPKEMPQPVRVRVSSRLAG